MSPSTHGQTSMRALVWQGPRQMELHDQPIPKPQPGEVLVRVAAVGICGSELSGYLGHNSLRKPPLVMGHEFSGTVADSGDSALATGTRVVVNPLLFCGNCTACRAGRFNLCENRALVGVHRPGAFAEYVAVPAAACLPIPDDLDAVQASMAEPTACAVRALGLTGIGLGGRLLVIGGGPIGLLCARLAARAGATVALSDTNPSRLQTARQWGVEHVLDSTEAADPAALSRVFGSEGPDAAVDAVGLAVTRQTAISAARRGGTVVFVGLHEPGVSFDANDLARNEINVRGCFAYTPADFETAHRMLLADLLPPSGPWLSSRPLTAGGESFRELVDTKPEVLKIVLRP